MIDYGLDDQGSIPCSGRDFSLRHRVQTGYGPHAAFQWVSGVKRLKREVEYFLPSNGKVKHTWTLTSTLLGVLRE
jgi:hypothetical protein